MRPGAGRGIKQYGNEIGGAKAVYTNDHLDFGLPNGIGPEVTAMKNAGVDLIIGCIDLNGMKTLAQELKRQGMRDSVTMYHTNTYDQAFVGKAGGLFDGDFVRRRSGRSRRRRRHRAWRRTRSGWRRTGAP